MSFEFEIDPKEAASAEFMTNVHRVLLREMTKAAKKSKVSRSDVARILSVDRSAITRALNGKSNLTIRSISDLLWAIGAVPEFDACQPQDEVGCNVPAESRPSLSKIAVVKLSRTTTQTVSWSGTEKKETSTTTSRGSKKLLTYNYAH